MKFFVKSGLAAGFVLAAMSFDAPQAEAGLFKKLFAKCGAAPSCCEPEPVCCEPEPVCCEPEPVCCEPEPEPVCCPEPAPEPVCCEPAPEPTCPEPAPEPCCEAAPEPAPEPCCASIYSLPVLAKGEILISISPITRPVSNVAVKAKSTNVAATTLVSTKR